MENQNNRTIRIKKIRKKNKRKIIGKWIVIVMRKNNKHKIKPVNQSIQDKRVLEKDII